MIGHHDPGRMRVAKTSTYLVMCPFPLFVALNCDHSTPTLQTDRQTDRRRTD